MKMDTLADHPATLILPFSFIFTAINKTTFITKHTKRDLFCFTSGRSQNSSGDIWSIADADWPVHHAYSLVVSSSASVIIMWNVLTTSDPPLLLKVTRQKLQCRFPPCGGDSSSMKWPQTLCDNLVFMLWHWSISSSFTRQICQKKHAVRERDDAQRKIYLEADTNVDCRFSLFWNLGEGRDFVKTRRG